MERRILAWTIAFAGLAATVSAQHGGGPKPHGSQAPKAHATPAPKTHTTGAPKTHGTSAPKTHVTGTSHGHAAKTSTPTSPKTSKAPKTTKTAKTTKTNTTTANTTGLSPVQQKLRRNTNLASKLQSRLPAGTNLDIAAAGFRNLGQFVAAVNVSNNLGIPFAELKTRMVDRNMSLGQAIQDARPRTTDTTVIVSRAEHDADDMIRTSETAKPKPKRTKTSTR